MNLSASIDLRNTFRALRRTARRRRPFPGTPCEPLEPRLLMAAAPTAPVAAGLSRTAFVNTPLLITYEQLLQELGAQDADGDFISLLITRVTHSAGFLYLRRGNTTSAVQANNVFLGGGDSLAWYPTVAGVIPAFSVRAADAALYAANETALYIKTDALPVVKIATANLQAWEAAPEAGIGRLTISRAGDLAQALEVAIAHISNNPSSAAGGARSGINYRLYDPSGAIINPGAASVIIPAGQSSVDLTVKAINDNSSANGLQQVGVIVQSDPDATPAYSPSTSAWVAGVNIIDSAPVISIRAAGTSIQEGVPNQPGFIITRTAAAGGTLDGVQTIVNLNYAGTSSTFPVLLHLSAPPVAFFDSGETTKGIILNTTSDGVARGTASALTIVAAISGTGFAVSGSRTASVQVIDTAPSVSIATAVATADETLGTRGQFVITRTGELAAPLSVNFTTGTAAANSVRNVGYSLAYSGGDPIDGNSITIPAGVAAVGIDVIPRDDGLNAAATVPLTIVTNGTLYNVASSPTGTVTITNRNRAPTVTLLTAQRVGTRNTPIEMSFDDLRQMTGARLADGSNGTLQLRVGTVSVGTLAVRAAGSTTTTAAAAGATLNAGSTLIWTPPANASVNAIAFTLLAVDGTVASVPLTSVFITVI